MKSTQKKKGLAISSADLAKFPLICSADVSIEWNGISEIARQNRILDNACRNLAYQKALAIDEISHTKGRKPMHITITRNPQTNVFSAAYYEQPQIIFPGCIIKGPLLIGSGKTIAKAIRALAKQLS
jgi:hypothetical protein